MKRISIAVGTVVVIGGLFLLASQFMETGSRQSPVRVDNAKLVKAYNAKVGPADAKVTVVEFLDPECETCAALNPMVKGIVNEYKDRVQFVVRYMLFHGNSELAALATEAAGKQGKYWEMQAQLFHRAGEWSHQDTPQNKVFEKIAGELSLDVEKFRTDMQDAQTVANIRADYHEGPDLGVNATPTFFVNGRMVQELTRDSIKKMIDEELKN